MKFYIVDAFTNSKFCGNPAGVVIVEEFPTDALMQSIALEFNISETCFVKRVDSSTFFIRWFTPNSEAPICGHATLAAFYVLIPEFNLIEGFEYTFKTIGEDLFAYYTKNEGQDYQSSWIHLTMPYYEVFDMNFDRDLVDLIDVVPQSMFKSHNCIIFQMNSEDEVLALIPNLLKISNLPCRALIVTAVGRECDFVSRYFAPKVGIYEDPVCASAHCRLIPFWSLRLQKHEMSARTLSSRGGVLRCKNLGNKVLISGQAVLNMTGKFC